MKILNLYLISIILLASCSNDKKTNVSRGENIKTKISIPNFNSDSSYYFVKKQVDFGPRVISTKAWDECSKYLVDKLNSYNAFVKVQEAPIKTYDGKEHVLRNIIASFSVEKNNRIALFAHWDSRHIADHDSVNTKQPILGANDGGSGVGVLLEIARNLNNQNPNIGVDIILFDAEDYGQPENSQYPIMNESWCLGSQYWSKNPHIKNYYAKYGILLDMVGGENARFRYESTSAYYASSPQIMDDHYYVNTLMAIPTIDIIEFDPSTKTNFNEHWHTHADNMNNVNRKTLKAVGQTVLNVIYSE